jgi:hypothetical protein
MHYPERPKRGDPITAAGADRVAEGVLAARVRTAGSADTSQSVTGTRVLVKPPVPMVLVILTSGWTRSATDRWYTATANEAILVQGTQQIVTRQPIRSLRVASPVAAGGVGTSLIAWWDASSGIWVTMAAEEDTSGSDSGSDQSGSDQSGSAGSGGSVGSDQSGSVGSDQSGSVGSDQSGSVGSDQSGSVGSDQSGSVGSDQSGSVGSDQSGSVGSDQSGSAGSDQSGSVGSDQSGSAGSDQSGSVGSDQSGSVGSGGGGLDDDCANCLAKLCVVKNSQGYVTDIYYDPGDGNLVLVPVCSSGGGGSGGGDEGSGSPTPSASME